MRTLGRPMTNNPMWSYVSDYWQREDRPRALHIGRKPKNTGSWYFCVNDKYGHFKGFLIGYGAKYVSARADARAKVKEHDNNYKIYGYGITR